MNDWFDRTLNQKTEQNHRKITGCFYLRLKAAILSCMFFNTKTKLLLILLFFSFCCKAQRYSVLITEIMADPEPVVGLPDAEYIELKNNSNTTIDLGGWKLQTLSATSGALPSYKLLPDSFVVICSRSNAALFGANTIGVPSFPALANGGTIISLLDARGNVVHAVGYSEKWYGNKVKAEGGWSFEMIDAANPCGGASNWKAATDPSGGTPGKINSVQGMNKDETPPSLLAATVADSITLLLQFDEPLDSASTVSVSGYGLEPIIPVAKAQALGPLFNEVKLYLQQPLQSGIVYSAKAAAVNDCAGNNIGIRRQVPTGIPQTADAADVIINEILFNPKPDGSDYVELYNRSKKIVDIGTLWMATHSAGGGNTPQKLSHMPLYLFPGSYAVITQNKEDLLRSYLVKNSDAVYEVSALPSLPDDKGSFVLLNSQGIVIDEISYKEDWHFALLADPSGIALERIDPEKPTQDKSNWTSAAATAGFGTPTYRNSQYKQAQSSNGVFETNPKIFSPDNDGFDDFCTISFQLNEPNYVGNLYVFDAGGRKLRHLVQNQTLAQSGFWRWDGLGENSRPLPSGTYILLLELFNLQGKKQQFKKAVVLAGK